MDGQSYDAWDDDEITWSATDATSGVRVVRVRVDGQIVDRDLPAGGPLVPSELGPGDHEIFVRAWDVAGNYVTERFDITVVADTTRPTIEVGGVTDGATYGDSRVLDLTVDATDDESGLERVRIWLDGTRIDDGNAVDDLVWSMQLPLWELDLGEHTLRVVAVDAAGNRRVTEVTFTVGTSIEDVWINLDRFEAAGLITADEADAVSAQLRTAERHLDRGKTAQARSALQRARDRARDIADLDVRRLLVRDLTELIRTMDGTSEVPNSSKDAKANAKAMEKAGKKAPEFVETPAFLDEDKKGPKG